MTAGVLVSFKSYCKVMLSRLMLVATGEAAKFSVEVRIGEIPPK